MLVTDLLRSGAGDAPRVIESIRQHSYGFGQWLKVAGGGKANLIEKGLRSRLPKPGEVALEFGVFVGYTTTRIGNRACADRGEDKHPGLLVVGLEVEPVHVCVARWVLDLAGLSESVE